MAKNFLTKIILSAILILLAVAIIPQAYSRTGVAVSPACYYTNQKGECHQKEIENAIYEYTFRVYNFDNKTREFKAYTKGDVPVKITPETFTLEQHDSQDCIRSKGCQEVKVLVDFSKKLGSKRVDLYVESQETTEGAVIVKQILNAKITAKIKSPLPRFAVSEGIFFAIIIIVLLSLIFVKLKRIFRKQKKITALQTEKDKLFEEKEELNGKKTSEEEGRDEKAKKRRKLSEKKPKTKKSIDKTKNKSKKGFLRKPLLMLVFLAIILFTQAFTANSYVSTGVRVVSAEIKTDFNIYSVGVPVVIRGSGYTPNSYVNLSIKYFSNLTDISGFPVFKQIDSDGKFTHTWGTTGLTEEKYKITGTDNSSHQTTALKIIELKEPYKFNNTIVFNQSHNPNPAETFLLDEDGNTLAADDEIFNFTLNYGQYYIIRVVLENSSLISKMEIEFLANEGDFTGNAIGFYEINNGTTDLAGVDILFTNFEYYTLVFNHAIQKNLAIYKCVDWNFTDASCFGTWEKIASLSSTSQYTSVRLEKGDPGFLIGNSCGDGVCDLNEDCTSCPADCGVCPPPISPGTKPIKGGFGSIIFGECGNNICEAFERITCPSDCEDEILSDFEQLKEIEYIEEAPGAKKYFLSETEAIIRYFRMPILAILALVAIYLVLLLKKESKTKLIFLKSYGKILVKNKSEKGIKHAVLRISPKENKDLLMQMKDAKIIAISAKGREEKETGIKNTREAEIKNRIENMELLSGMLKDDFTAFKTEKEILVFMNLENAEMLQEKDDIIEIELVSEDEGVGKKFIEDSETEIFAQEKDKIKAGSPKIIDKAISRLFKNEPSKRLSSADETKTFIDRAYSIFRKDYTETSNYARQKTEFFSNLLFGKP